MEATRWSVLVMTCVLCAQSCPTLCDPLDCSPAGSFIHGIFQARILEWVATSYSRGSFWPRDRTRVSCNSCLGRQILLPLNHVGSPRNIKVCVYIYFVVVQSLKSCLTLCDPMDCSLPGFSVHGIFQARVLEWVATSFSRGSSWPRDRTSVSYGFCIAGEFFISEPQGKLHC